MSDVKPAPRRIGILGGMGPAAAIDLQAKVLAAEGLSPAGMYSSVPNALGITFRVPDNELMRLTLSPGWWPLT